MLPLNIPSEGTPRLRLADSYAPLVPYVPTQVHAPTEKR
jgi:hypothetical protein